MGNDGASDGPPRHHRLDKQHVTALFSGGGDADSVTQLLTVERSWRMLQLRALLDLVRPEHDVGPLASVGTAWALLVEAERRDPPKVAGLLLHPQVGIWAGYVLRRLRGTADSPAPLWVDLGYLHTLAAAAALSTGADFRITVPVRDGFTVLPTLGAAHVPGTRQWDRTDVHGAGGSGVVETPDGAVVVGGSRWNAMPGVRVEAAGQTLAVRLDCLDPYRNLRAPTPPHLLSEPELRHWRELLTQAWRLLVETSPPLAAPMAQGLFSVVPQPPAERFRTMSASAGDAFGSMIMSEPRDAVELAVTMVHEFQHIKLGALLHLAPLHTGEPVQRLYAPWRDDPRPLGGLLQGVYAFAGITEFWRALRERSSGSTAALAHFEFARWRRQVHATLAMLAELPQLTEVGKNLVHGLMATADGWRSDDVPARVRVAADAAVSDHRARWRLHHLRPSAEVVDALAASWTAGVDRPEQAGPAPVVAADPGARGLDARAVLMLWRLTDPAGFDQLRRDPSTIGAHVTGAGPSDLAYVAGELDHARDGYLAALSVDPDSPSAWAGLGLVLSAAGPGRAADALMRRPELVRAVHQAVRSSTGEISDPVKLAGWIGPG
ncbi:aKG-HExxH-type peptide beta-hydroxylase [Paractinoplanes brasiliensis]|uniref:HEXXH motif-containing protein n=1 Tax=Paractinoplanes brasiliensis TaxID=52695 RepID=A0A4R6J9Q3_9ACTN|nr:HEXXH motif-containing putative peptide modification protein [Actinoplanes brasiliensis]TDO32370.1 HEXXH motif-containing protein [Actinoplanes brasiliensis]GID27763.1 HEXXH motif domain-containing protein [Actinoplanes brasiliensis]